MNIDEMKLEVCKKLPKLIEIASCWWKDFEWKETEKRVNWPTEGLQVCHEAEKLLTNEQIQDYFYALNEAVGLVDSTSPAWIKEWSVFTHTHATYEQKMEALCRVWFPEKFHEIT